jgi:hypothetical protein
MKREHTEVKKRQITKKMTLVNVPDKQFIFHCVIIRVLAIFQNMSLLGILEGNVLSIHALAKKEILF